MRLISCYIENFGSIKEYSHSFDKGLNCFVSENGSGKTTLTVFLFSMLYGMPDNRKQSLDENERKKYKPWQGGTYGGQLTIEVNKKRYTIERTFGQKNAEDSFRLIDSRTGNVSYDYSENIGEELFGIDRDGFLRTVFLSEKNLPGKNDNKTIAAKLSDLVGSDGDVGGFDRAVALLDERRKFYSKKSGNCEINNLRAKISSLNTELDGVKRKEELLSQFEERMKLSSRNIKNAEAVKGELMARLDTLSREKERRIYEERYLAMLGELKSESERLKECEDFFGGKIPSAGELDEARLMQKEAQRLDTELSNEDSGDYMNLRAVFGEEISFLTIEETEKKHIELKKTEAELALINSAQDDCSARMTELFPLYVPKESELDAHIKRGKKRLSLPAILCMLIGVLLAGGAVASGMLINPLIYLSVIPALIFIIASVFMLVRTFGGSSADTDEFILRIRGFKPSSKKDELLKIKKELAVYSEIKAERDEKRAELTEEKDRLTRELQGFTEKFKRADGTTPSIEEIKRDYTRYYTMSVGEAERSNSNLERKRLVRELYRKTDEFLSGFKTTSEDPFSEIQGKVTEYNYSLVNVHRLERECEEFKTRYGITEIKPHLNEKTDDVSDELKSAESALSELARERTLLEREYSELLSECERREELEGEIAEHSERLEQAIKNLGIIQSTVSLLGEACENITSRYIGKTQESFEKYQQQIAKDTGEFTIDTSFSLSKNERGAMRSEESYSRGTRDLYALSLRLALIDSLYDGESPFIILDDPLLTMDDEKTKRARALISSLAKEKQILYFTCSKSRAI